MNKYSEQYRGENTGKSDNSATNSAPVAADKKAATANKPAAGAKTVQVTPAMGVKNKWPQQVKAAKTQWGKLSEAEILKSDGNPQQLSGLVQQRYAITRDVADKQVKSFLDKCNLA